MKKITVREIMELKPCSDYPEEKVKVLIGGGKTPLEILDLDIPKNDKFWLLLRPEYISERNLHLLACDFTQEVAHLKKAAAVNRLTVHRRDTNSHTGGYNQGVSIIFS